VMVSDGREDAVSESGLTAHAGRPVVTWVEVTLQVKSTVPVKVEPVVRVRTEVAEPPGSTADGCNCAADSVNAACAPEIAASDNMRSDDKTTARRTCRKFTINGRQLTTFDSSTGANAARSGREEFQMPVNGMLHGDAAELLRNAPERILDYTGVSCQQREKLVDEIGRCVPA
jgi:azurin